MSFKELPDRWESKLIPKGTKIKFLDNSIYGWKKIEELKMKFVLGDIPTSMETKPQKTSKYRSLSDPWEPSCG